MVQMARRKAKVAMYFMNVVERVKVLKFYGEAVQKRTAAQSIVFGQKIEKGKIWSSSNLSKSFHNYVRKAN